MLARDTIQMLNREKHTFDKEKQQVTAFRFFVSFLLDFTLAGRHTLMQLVILWGMAQLVVVVGMGGGGGEVILFAPFAVLTDSYRSSRCFLSSRRR